LLQGLKTTIMILFLKVVKRLPQSHNLIYDLNNHSYEIKRYYQISFNDDIEKYNLDESVKKI